MRKDIPVPSGFESEQDFLKDMREKFTADLSADQENRDAALEDSEFVAGEQWDDTMRAERERNNKPCLTINRLPAFVAQVVGNRRMNETVIKVTPDVSGNKDTAQIRQGLIRSIEKHSNADRVYNNAFQNAVICGIGNFSISLEYAADDVFDQDIRHNKIPNPLAVVWDRNSVDPTGRDAERCFVIDRMTEEDFRRAFGEDAVGGDLGFDSAVTTGAEGWANDQGFLVAEYWRLVRDKRELALMQDGEVRDVTDMPPEEWLADVVMDHKTGLPYVREKLRTSAEMHICSGSQILDGPYKLPINRVPVFRVPGWEVDVGYARRRWGLVRFAKDPQRMHNYWRSVIVEKLMQTPKAPWLAADTAIEGYEKQWEESNVSTAALLVYNAESGQPPQRTAPAQMETALINEAGMAMQDIKDVTNLHEASFGMQSNEVSGKAIMARQRVGEVGTYIYEDNLNMAIEECGRVINDLIPTVYDTPRVISVIQVENGMEQETEVVINDLVAEDSIDITSGKYKVSVTTGPSQVTRRIEAKEGMLNMVNAMPQTMTAAADLIVEAEDWPNSNAIAERLRNIIGPQAMGISPEELTPEQQAAMQAQQQVAAQQQQLAQQQLMLQMQKDAAEIEKTRAATQEIMAKIQKMAHDMQIDVAEVTIDQDKVDNEERRTNLEYIRTGRDTNPGN